MKTLKDLMKKKTRPQRPKHKRESKISKFKSFHAIETPPPKFYASGNEVDIRNLLRESQLRRDSKARREGHSGLDSSNQSIKARPKRTKAYLENLMKSSGFLRRETSLTSSGLGATPKKLRAKRMRQSKSPERLSLRAARLGKSGSKRDIKHSGRMRPLRKAQQELEQNIDLYRKAKQRRSPESVSVLEAVNIYGKAFHTMNNHPSSKYDSRNSHKSTSGSRDEKGKRTQPKLHVQHERSIQRESHRVRSPKRRAIQEMPAPKSKAKSRSNEPKKQRLTSQLTGTARRKKVNVFMKSRSRSMSSTSDVSPQRSRSLNKTNSELKKSGSFIDADQHVGRIIYGYRIEEPVGEGAYARVYRALHVNTKTPVAVKGGLISVQQGASLCDT